MTAVKLTSAQHLERAAWAHTNLNMFDAVISLLEGGHLYGTGSQESVDRIISICRMETAKQLRLYDRHAALAVRSALQEASQALEGAPDVKA